jgi:Tfp pilus assembly protein PilN
MEIDMKLTAYVHWVNKEWYDAPRFEVWPSDMTLVGANYVLVGTVDLDFDIPAGFDPRPAQIDALKEQQKKIMADSQAKVTAIEEQIQKLQAIEFKGEQ